MQSVLVIPSAPSRTIIYSNNRNLYEKFVNAIAYREISKDAAISKQNIQDVANKEWILWKGKMKTKQVAEADVLKFIDQCFTEPGRYNCLNWKKLNKTDN